MGVLNTEAARAVPPLIEDVAKTYLVDLPAAADTIVEMAQSTGAGQFIKDAEAFKNNITELAEMVKKTLGNEGDLLTDDGTVWAAVTAAKKAEAAFGGEN